jgi:hypothetical protein
VVEKNAATTVCVQGSALQGIWVWPPIPRSRVSEGLAGFVSAPSFAAASISTLQIGLSHVSFFMLNYTMTSDDLEERRSPVRMLW